MRPPRQLASRSGLSLIEILAVIATVSVLAAVLLQAVGRVTSRANQAMAANDLRQIHLAVGHFANDNDGWLPGPGPSAAASGFSKNDLKFARYVAPYLMSVDFSSAPSTQVFRLPQLEPREYYRKNVKPRDVRAVAYRLNTSDFTDPDFTHPFGDSDVSPRVSPKRLLAVPEPARNRMIWDLDRKNLEGNPGWKTEIPKEPLYGNSRLVLYFDGHVDYVPVE